MATRNIYRVQWINGAWHVTHQGASLSSHSTKESAIGAGIQVAKANQPSQLVIHNKDGSIETEYTYGDDPYPPPG